jgi:hypothetical protein
MAIKAVRLETQQAHLREMAETERLAQVMLAHAKVTADAEMVAGLSLLLERITSARAAVELAIRSLQEDDSENDS